MSRLADDPIILSDGGELVTLRDAGECIQALAARRQETPEWQTATRILIATAEARDFMMHARIATLRALGKCEQTGPL
jgi:hypothetical protein